MTTLPTKNLRRVGPPGALALAAVLAHGCQPAAPAPSPAPVMSPRLPTASPRPSVPAAAAAPDVSWETPKDERFAAFLRDNSGGMVRKAAVGIESRGELKVELSRLVSPEDTLPLTKSLLAGARKDFPDRPITLSVYDPDGQPILKARYRPGEGVHYTLAEDKGHAPHAAPAASPSPGDEPAKPKGGSLLARGGVTPKDEAFASWAETAGKGMLRYVQADLERRGRLWFGVTREVKPDDVKPLTQSLLKGAREAFPRGEIAATVFDPDGGRIGRATLEPSGEVRWQP